MRHQFRNCQGLRIDSGLQSIITTVEASSAFSIESSHLSPAGMLSDVKTSSSSRKSRVSECCRQAAVSFSSEAWLKNAHACCGMPTCLLRVSAAIFDRLAFFGGSPRDKQRIVVIVLKFGSIPYGVPAPPYAD
jgi:hypothetical protein